MTYLFSCLCFRRSCLYVSSEQRCLERGFQTNETKKVGNYLEFQPDSSILFVDNCSVECYSTSQNLNNFFIVGYSHKVHVKLINRDLSLSLRDFNVANLSIDFVAYPNKIIARNSKIKVPDDIFKMTFDYDIFTLTNSKLPISSGSLSFEDYQKFRYIEIFLDLECHHIIVTNVYSLPNNTNIIISGNSFRFQIDNFGLSLITSDFQSIDLHNQVVAIREYSKICQDELTINTRNSTVIFNGKFRKTSFILREKEIVYDEPTSSLIFNSKDCPGMLIESAYNIIFNTNGTYTFPNMVSYGFLFVSAPIDTVIEIKDTNILRVNITEGSYVRIREIKARARVQIYGSLHLPFINHSRLSWIDATEIVFENSPICSVPNIPQITCSKAFGNILVDVNSFAVGVKKSIIRFYDSGNDSDLNIQPINNTTLGEVFHWEMSSKSVEVWKEDCVVEWFACISDNESKCQKNSMKFETVKDFTENFKINDHENIYVESFCEELVSIDVTRRMNVSLSKGRFKISGDELIDTLWINESTIKKEDKSNITCKTLYIRNSMMNEIAISPTVDLHIIMPCAIDPKKYSGSPTVHIENGNTDISINELVLYSFGSYYIFISYDTQIIIENVTGTIESFEYPFNMKIINSNINFVISQNEIDDRITIINSKVNFISQESEMCELTFKDPTKIRNITITSNFPMMVVRGDLSLDSTACNYKDGFVSFNGKVRLFDENVDYKRSRFKDLVVGIDNIDSTFFIVDRIFLESSPPEINISSIEFATNKRPEILMNLTLSQPTLINIKSSASEYTPPRIRINNIVIDDDYILGTEFPLVCTSHGNLDDFDIIIPELENYTMDMSVYYDYINKLQCAMVSFDEDHIIEENVEYNAKNWIILSSIFVTVGTILIVVLISAVVILWKKSRRVKHKSQYESIT